MKIKLTYVLTFTLSFLLLSSILIFAFYPVKKSIDYCEDRNWDGAEYNTGVKEVNLFGKNEDIKVKCNKAEETDAIIGILDGLYFWERD